jgi:peptidoglycan/xylan/chitin deacetylase (PgdA/CDA1 family)
MTALEPSDDFVSRQYRICGYMILDDGTIVYGNALEDSADAASKRSSIMRVYNDDWRSHPQDFKLIAIGLDGDPHHKEVADDVPLVRILNAVNNNENGSVTLNIGGDNLRANGDKIIRYAIDVCGAEIGTYTWNATKLPTLSNEERYEWISSAVAYTEETLGVEIRFLRPPYISGSAEVWETCRQLGLTAYGMNRVWTTDPADTAEMLAGAYDGAFWLLHAHALSTPGAVEEAVPILVEQGYRFCTMSELFEYMGKEPVPGRMYNTGVMHD